MTEWKKVLKSYWLYWQSLKNTIHQEINNSQMHQSVFCNVLSQNVFQMATWKPQRVSTHKDHSVGAGRARHPTESTRTSSTQNIKKCILFTAPHTVIFFPGDGGIFCHSFPHFAQSSLGFIGCCFFLKMGGIFWMYWRFAPTIDGHAFFSPYASWADGGHAGGDVLAHRKWRQSSSWK